MRRMRFLAFGLISFIAALLGAFLSPSTWLHKSLAIALCGVLSANPALCTNNAIAQFQEASATNPVKVETTQSNNLNFLQADRSTEFLDDAPSPVNSINSQQSSQYNQTDSEENPKVFIFYINGIQTPYSTYTETKNLIDKKLLKPANLRFNGLKTYNVGGSILGDLSESALQEIFQRSLSADGSSLEDSIVQEIKRIDDDEAEKAKNDCKPRKRAKFILIGHSQGTIFINNIALKLSKRFSRDRQIQQRVKLLALAPFTNFVEVREQGFRVEYVLREDDFPALGFVTSLIPRVSTRRIPHNLSCLKSDCPFKLAFKKRLKQALISHSVENYLGVASPSEYSEDAQKALNMAQNRLLSLTNSSSGEYKEIKKDCSSTLGKIPEPRNQDQQKPVTTLAAKACNIPEDFWKSHKRIVGPVNLYEDRCLIKGSVMTRDGLADGQTSCGICYTPGLNFGPLPHKVSCDYREDVARRNPISTCPDNWGK